MTPALTADILCRSDAGESVADIVGALSVSPGTVYSVLRRERPKRKRKPRIKTSVVPAQVAALMAAGTTEVSRIALLLDVKRQYVYRILNQSEK